MTEAIVQQMTSGHLSPVTIILWTLLGLAAALAGGALSGMRLGGKHLGNELAALMGALFGGAGAVPGVLLGLIVIAVFVR